MTAIYTTNEGLEGFYFKQDGKLFIRQFPNIGGSWTVVWSYNFMGNTYYFKTIHPQKYVQP